jgi:hypothetical protein
MGCEREMPSGQWLWPISSGLGSSGRCRVAQAAIVYCQHAKPCNWQSKREGRWEDTSYDGACCY